MSIHMFRSRNTFWGTSWRWSLRLMSSFRSLINLYLGIELDELYRSTHFLCKSVSSRLDNLCQGSNSILNARFDLMQLVPKVLLYYTHVFPSIHSVSFNITYFILILSLSLSITIKINLQISIIRALDDYLGYGLWCFDFVYFHFVLESLCNYVA